MGRCWTCCQENCGFGNCTCSCHRDALYDRSRSPNVAFKEVELSHEEVELSPSPPKELTYTFYAIANSDNLEKAKWYCTYSAQKSSGWKKDFEDARIWVRRSAAKSKATALGSEARLVEFHVTKTVVIDQTEHLKKVAEERRQRELQRERAANELAIRMAKEDIARAEARLKALEGKSK